uniref:NADH-ubiquinone oxidoreductase chain 5 n=1 Tax=Pselaphinae sp. 6 EF-2015 TaxID=1756860 RepID=A0A0S2M8M4_9COLE|nr:NADH deshydrogenase subunit 5 [Pselaphinae sp. 6 EF-2015]
MFLFLSVLLFFTSLWFMLTEYVLILEFSLISVNSSLIVMSILLDWMSLLFMSFVLFISSMVIYYSMQYMEGDLNLHRFIMLVFMFVMSMMLLIISPNLISILLGWDGLGLVSYCLVIYYQNVKSYNAGMLTALTNRIGDVALLMSIAWMMNYGSWNYYYYLECMKMDFVMNMISLMVMLAAFTKSAQIPFSAWLPAAMAAPTPVSSLVHSSTLVTAGVYLLIRFNLCLNSFMLLMLMFLSTLTMFMAGLGANLEFDLKKIIALSTLSQLGLMMSILSLMEYKLALFHLLTHALFKATLFLCAGNIIHMMMNCQDIRFMGGIIVFMPITSSLFIISNLALCGMPFLSGFYSKDLILEVISMSYLNFYIYLIYFISTGLTVCYTFRLIYYLMMGEFNFFSLNMIADKNNKMIYSMLSLIGMIIVSGSMLMWTMFTTPYFIVLSMPMKMMTMMVIIIGGLLGYECSVFYLNYKLKSLNMLSMNFYSSMWNMPVISTFGVNYYVIYMGSKIYNNLDQGWCEYFGGQNFYSKLCLSLKYMQFINKYNFNIYLMLMVLWIIVIMIIFYLNSLFSA